MGDVADLLMPKLCLTMTEGTVARWIAAPGQKFSAGDVIVVIETDKIANEVEAPSAGELVTLLSSEGDVVPVGAPIARWRLDAASSRPVTESVKAEASAPTNAPAAQPRAVAAADTNRIIATPYARRLALETSLDLADITGSGPRGRIKAVDVLRARETPAASRAIAPTAIAMERAAPVPTRSATLSFATAVVDVSALRALDARLAGARDRPFERRAYIALACIKALGTESGTAVRLGFEADGVLAALEGTDRDTLSAVASRLKHLQVDDAGGSIAIFIVEGRARVLVPALPHEWHMARGVGGVHAARGGEATHEMTLALVHDPATVDHTRAAQLLDRIAALLEEPLHLLAG